jgi:glycosyltransferase involved in cell wall biosynthesis
VATTRLVERDFTSLNGVEIVGFDIAGNRVRGMSGEVERYREFVRTFPCDALMIKAAQQWTFDALWPVLDEITCRKVFIPCGFSGLYEPMYQEYFRELPAVLRKWDHLIYYAEHYRDVDFTRAHGIDNFTILPNGASELEFNAAPDGGFRQRHGIPEDSFVMLTVGSLTGMKGHREIAEAFAQLKLEGGRHATLLLNGNEPPRPPVAPPPVPEPAGLQEPSGDPGGQGGAAAGAAGGADPVFDGLVARALGVYRREGIHGMRQRVRNYAVRAGSFALRTGKRVLGPVRIVSVPLRLGVRAARVSLRIASSVRHEGVAATARKVHRGVYERTRHRRIWRALPEQWQPMPQSSTLQQWLAATNRRFPATRLALHTDFPRAELVQAYLAADLFVFASNIEYSPLVLYEAAAAGTPFLTVPVGNSEEIARWTGAGVICPAPKDERGYTRVEPAELARAIARLAQQQERLRELGATGRRRWEANFSWDVIAHRYEAILQARAEPCRQMVIREAP